MIVLPKLYKLVESEINKLEGKDKPGITEEDARKIWYWEGYRSALVDVAADKEFPSLPSEKS